MLIISTSPCRMRNRLLSRSMPLEPRNSATLLKVALHPSIWYWLELSRRAMRLTTIPLPSTTS